MILKQFLTLFALLAVLISSVAFAAPAMAGVFEEDLPANEAAEACRSLDEEGELDDSGHTRGECVNLLMGPSSENANNHLAAYCSLDAVQEFLTKTTNKGQCIQALRNEREDNGGN